MTYIVSGGALNSTHSTRVQNRTKKHSQQTNIRPTEELVVKLFYTKIVKMSKSKYM